MPSIRPSFNCLLQALPAAELEALGPRLELVQLVRETVLVEAGSPLTHVYLPHSGAISMMVRFSDGRTVEAATIGRDSVFGAAVALDGGISLTSAVVVLPGTASVLGAADFRAAADRSVTFRAVVARHEQALLALASNPQPATLRTRSKLACRAGCCVHAISAATTRCR